LVLGWIVRTCDGVSPSSNEMLSAAYLRQSVLLSAYETPEIRSIYNKSLKNVAGKLRTEHTWRPLQVPDGIDQQFNRVEYTNLKDELDKRFDAFTKTLLPAVLKSAVQSANTLVFVPSSFDFIRVHNYFRKRGDISFVALSEYVLLGPLSSHGS
jgi:U3 small nucleolar RNA-associated protein 25